MADLQITPDLKWPYIEDMFDNSQNDLLLEVADSALTDLGSSAPAAYNAKYKSTASRIFLLDIGSGDKYYEVPLADFEKLTWANGHYIFRLSSSTTVIGHFELILNG